MLETAAGKPVSEHRDGGEEKYPIDAIDHRHVGVMVDPPAPDYQERDCLGRVLRPRVLEIRPKLCAESVHGDVDDQKRRGYREDTVGEGLQSGVSTALGGIGETPQARNHPRFTLTSAPAYPLMFSANHQCRRHL